MEFIGAAASVAQLLAQVISLWQQISQARQTVRDATKLLEDHLKQLEDLNEIVRWVQEEPELQRPEIEDQLVHIHNIATELYKHLEGVAKSQKTSTAQQYIRAIGTGDRKERALRGILERLSQAKTDLSLRMQLAHVGLSGTLRDGFNAMIPTILRIDESMQKLMGSRLKIAAQLEPAIASHKDEKLLRLTADEQEALGLKIDRLTIRGNSSLGDADQLNVITGTKGSWRPITASISNNKATGRGTQRNVIGTG